MGTDNFLEIGSKHKICEDYTLIGDKYIIVSDGCSTSPMTDVGARILTISAATAIKRFLKQSMIPDYEQFAMTTLHTARGHINAMGLPEECLNATLLITFRIFDSYYTYVYGDGHVCIEYKSGKKVHWEYVYGKEDDPDSNAPFYLNYWFEPEKYIEQFGTDNLTVKSNGEKMNFPDNKGSLIYHDSKVITLATDGVESFLIPGQDKLDAVTAMNEFCSYKNYKGEFVQRRCKAALKKFGRTWENISHYDDIAVAAIYHDE